MQLRVGRAVQADFTQQQRHLEHVGHAVALRDHVVGDARGAVARMHLSRHAQDGEFAVGLRRVFDVRRAQQPRRRQFFGQHANAAGLVQCVVGHLGPRGAEQFGDDTLVHVRVLPQVDCREMKAEDVDRAPQLAQAAASDQAGVVRLRANGGWSRDPQRIRPRLSRAEPRPPHAAAAGACRGPGGRGDARVKPGDRAAIGFVAAMRTRVGRTFGQRSEFRRHVGDQRGHRQFGAQRVQLLEIEREHARRLHAQRALEHGGRHERIAVAVAADPRADPQERRHLGRRRSPGSGGSTRLRARRTATALRAGTSARKTTGRSPLRRALRASRAAGCASATATVRRAAATRRWPRVPAA